MKIDISKDEINQKIADYMNGNSEKAKKISKEYGVKYWKISKYRKINLEELELEIYKLKDIILKALKEYSSEFANYNVDSLFSDTRITYQADGRGVVSLTFDSDAVRRPSLYPEEYPDGIENIVLLLTNGYKCHSSPPTGIWHGRVTEGWKRRKPDDFLWDAVEKYNNLSELGCIALLDKRYKK